MIALLNIFQEVVYMVFILNNAPVSVTVADSVFSHFL